MPRFSEIVLDHARSPNNRLTLPAADSVGVAGTPGHGMYLVLQLVLDGDQITDAAFQCHNCGATVAAGSVLVELVADRSVADCAQFTRETVLCALDGLPPDKMHCADMAIVALRDALNHAASEEGTEC